MDAKMDDLFFFQDSKLERHFFLVVEMKEIVLVARVALFLTRNWNNTIHCFHQNWLLPLSPLYLYQTDHRPKQIKILIVIS